MLTATEARIAGILATVGRIGADNLTSSSRLEGLGLDSVAMVEVIFAIEEGFDIAVPLTIQPGGLTLGSLAELVQGLHVGPK